MTRMTLPALLFAIAACGCFHDNASPFVHGARNAPSRGGSTHVARQSSATETTGTAAYGSSSGYAGGVEKERRVSDVPQGGSSSGASAAVTTTPMPAAPASGATPSTGSGSPAGASSGH